MVATSSRAPPVSRTCFQVCSRLFSGRPFSNATRSRSASLKSISPFIARAVIAAIVSPRPANPANSSSVSPVMMVLSMSAISSAFRRPRVFSTIASMAAPPSAARTLSMSGSAAIGMSAASPSDRMTASPPASASRTRAIRAVVRLVACRLAIRVRTWLMVRGWWQAERWCASRQRDDAFRDRCYASSLPVDHTRNPVGTFVVTNAVQDRHTPAARDSLPPALIVAGPTASGKSALALEIARHVGGTIVNADSMQVYRELRVLTARPSPADEALVPHLLYGVRSAAEAGSVAWWRGAALDAMDRARAAGRLPILTGGTGLYFAALAGGLAEIPDPGPEARAEARRLLAELGAPALHAGLAKVDPATAARLRPADSQRIARAWEVWRGTGMGLAAWQNRRSTAAPWCFAAILLDPPRDALRAAI